MGEVTADGDIIVGRIRPKNNPLIHRSEVGKPSFHNDMPPLPADYTFGAPLKRDPEGAGDVMLTWQSHCPPKSKMTYDFGRDFLTLNKKSVLQGCTSAKDVADYRKETDARIKPKVSGKKPSTVPEHVMKNPHHSFGSKSGHSESVADLIQNRYEFEWVEEQRQRQQRMEEAASKERQRKQQRAAALSQSRPASLLPEIRDRATPSPHPKEFFTLKQFRNVPSRFRTPTPGADQQ